MFAGLLMNGAAEAGEDATAFGQVTGTHLSLERTTVVTMVKTEWWREDLGQGSHSVSG